MGVENDAATQELWKQSEGSRKCWKQIKGRSKTGKVSNYLEDWEQKPMRGLGHSGTGPCGQSEAPGKLESWCFLRREKWVSTSQFVIVAGKYEEGLESWARSRSKPRCSKPRRGSDHRGEKNWESFSQVIREFVVGQRFIFPRKSVLGVRCHQG